MEEFLLNNRASCLHGLSIPGIQEETKEECCGAGRTESSATALLMGQAREQEIRTRWVDPFPDKKETRNEFEDEMK